MTACGCDITLGLTHLHRPSDGCPPRPYWASEHPEPPAP